MTISKLSDEELISGFKDLIFDEREKLLLQLQHLAELDRRKLFFHYPSLRSYLVSEHGMEEWQAERKTRAARLLIRFPRLEMQIQSGKMNLTLLELAQGCAHREKLSDTDLSDLFEKISGMSTRAAKREIAVLYPESMVIPRDRIHPLNEELSEIRFVANQELLEKLDEIRGLLAHSHPGVTFAELIDLLATEYRERHHPEEKAKRAEARQHSKQNQSETVDKPTAHFSNTEEKRTASAALVNELTRTEGYQCSYVDPVTGKPCLSKYGLQIDHKKAWSCGGKTKLSNLRYLCQNHHARVSFLQFGERSKYYFKRP